MTDRAVMYWYARGYFDGRSVGISDDSIIDHADADRQAYKEGYDRGVTDYCDMDETPCSRCGAMASDGTLCHSCTRDDQEEGTV